MTDRELMQQAMEAMLNLPDDISDEMFELIKALKKRLAQPEQEPVAWPCHIIEADFSERTITLGMESGDYKVSAGTHYLSTAQPQRTWVGLTDEEKAEIWANNETAMVVTATEKKLKEKNT